MDNTPKYRDYTVISRDSVLKGKHQFKGTTYIYGHIDGEVSVSAGDLFIERSGFISGEIHCENIDIYGKVQANIHCSGKVICMNGSSFSGQLKAKDLIIKAGALTQMQAAVD